MAMGPRSAVKIALPLLIAFVMLLVLATGATAAPYSWKDISGGLGALSVKASQYDATRDILYVGAAGGGVWKCVNPGTTAAWTKISNPGDIGAGTANCLYYDYARNLLFAGTSEGGVFFLTGPDTSTAWVSIAAAPISGYHIKSLAYDTARNILYAGDEAPIPGDGHGPWRCVDPTGAHTWTMINSGLLPYSGGDTSKMMCLSLLYDQQRNLLYAGCYAYGVVRCANPDSAPAWTDCVPSGDKPMFTGSLAMDTARNIVYASWITDGVWRLDNPSGVATGTRISNGLEAVNKTIASSLVYDPSIDTLYSPIYEWSSTVNWGVWMCPNPEGTPTWEVMGGDVSTFRGYTASLDQNNGKLYAGFSGHGVWSAPIYKSYLAEGTSAWGFATYITIENPHADPCTAQITYNTTTGPRQGPDVVLPGMSQATVNPADIVPNQDFSTVVTCKEGMTLAVDRTMSWTGPGAKSPEGHSSVSVLAPSKVWYLPEGSTAWGFECWLLIQNPNAVDANCTVTYMTEHDGPIAIQHTVKAGSRQSFDVSKDIGNKDSSIKVEADVPVIPERAMYKNNRREGHDSIGTIAPATDYYLAEGTTAWGFTTYVLVQNPNSSPTDVTVTYMTSGGPQVQPTFTMPANSRKTIRVNDIKPSNGAPIDVSNIDLSTQVHGTQPIIAERAMYWGASGPLGEACHGSIGMSTAHGTFYLPDGQTSDGRETWTLVQNPNGSDITVTISYLTPTGQNNVSWEETIPAKSRRTFDMKDKGINGRAAVMVNCKTGDNKTMMVERAMYWNSRGAGTDTIGGFSN